MNNVGGRRINTPTEELPLEEWQRIVDLNLTQAFICAKMIGGAMISRPMGTRDQYRVDQCALAGQGDARTEL